MQVKQLAAYLTQREDEGEPAFSYTQATVTRYGTQRLQQQHSDAIGIAWSCDSMHSTAWHSTAWQSTASYGVIELLRNPLKEL